MIKISENWYRQRRGKRQGIKGTLSDYTYHYRRKSAKISPVLLVIGSKQKNFSDYGLALMDIDECLLVCDEIKKLDPEKHLLLVRALFKSIFITYGKLFRSSDGSLGRNKLSPRLIKDKKLKDLHKLIMDIRDNYVAHSTKELYEDARLVVPIPVKSKAKKKGKFEVSAYIERDYTSWDHVKLVEVKELLTHLRNELISKMSTTQHYFNELLSRIPLEVYYKKVKTRKGYIKIDEEELSQMAGKTVLPR